MTLQDCSRKGFREGSSYSDVWAPLRSSVCLIFVQDVENRLKNGRDSLLAQRSLFATMLTTSMNSNNELKQRAC